MTYFSVCGDTMAYRRTEYTYDTSGRITACVIYGAADAENPLYTYQYTYDAAGRVSTLAITRPSGSETVSFTYSAEGQLISSIKTTGN